MDGHFINVFKDCNMTTYISADLSRLLFNILYDAPHAHFS